MSFLVPPAVAGLAVTAGVAAHLVVFIRGEWHMRAPHIIMFHTLLITAVYFLLSRQEDSSSAGRLVFGAFAAYLCGLFGSMTAYRVLFHSLKSFPGPRTASISKLWHVYQNLNSRNYELLDQMYRDYGEFVRIGIAPQHEQSVARAEHNLVRIRHIRHD